MFWSCYFYRTTVFLFVCFLYGCGFLSGEKKIGYDIFCMRVRLLSGQVFSHFRELWLARSHSGGVTSGVCAAPNLSQAMAPGEVRWLLGIGCRGSVENSELGAAALLKAVWWDLRLASLLTHLLWSPCVIGRTIIFSCCDLFFFPRLISAVGDWMSTIVPHMVWL